MTGRSIATLEENGNVLETHEIHGIAKITDYAVKFVNQGYRPIGIEIIDHVDESLISGLPMTIVYFGERTPLLTKAITVGKDGSFISEAEAENGSQFLIFPSGEMVFLNMDNDSIRVRVKKEE